MGLDRSELERQVERRFGVRLFLAARADSINTVGDLYSLLLVERMRTETPPRKHLRRPRWVIAVAVYSLLGYAAFGLLMDRFQPSGYMILAMILSPWVALGVGLWMTQKLAVELEPIPRDRVMWNDLCEVIGEQTGVSPTRLGWNTPLDALDALQPSPSESKS